MRCLQKVLTLSCFAMGILTPRLLHAKTYDICPGYKLDAVRKIKFNANELKLFCGDPDVNSWQKIPSFQAKYFIKIFLQDRGYHFPTFTEEKDSITIQPGDQTRIKKILVTGSPPPFLDVTRRWQMKGAVMSPTHLTALENWTKSVLATKGYPCPQVGTEADPHSGIVTLSVDPGPFQKIVQVVEEPVEDLSPGTLARYRTFKLGDPYNAKELALTSNWIETTDGILQSSYFLTDCSEEGTVLRQKSIPGSKHLFKIAAGANSEDIVVGSLTWKRVRIGDNGSSFQTSLRGSLRKQWINAQASLHPFTQPSPWYLNPIAYTIREDEDPYEFAAINTAFLTGIIWNTRNTGFRLRFGPKFNFTHTFRGADPGNTEFVSASFRFDIASHNYLYEAFDMRNGYSLNAEVDLNHDGLGSSVTAQQFTLTGDAVWNLGGFDPSIFVLAVRGLAGTTLTDRGSSTFSTLPPSFFYYLGGSTTLRGFSRNELPRADRGALTALYSGAEMRFANVFPLNIQPLALLDISVLGQDSLGLDFPVYWSPGVGFRWPSLVGVFRFTAAHGFLIHNNNQANEGLGGWEIFMSYGEEF